jgi:hypothetical protein
MIPLATRTAPVADFELFATEPVPPHCRSSGDRRDFRDPHRGNRPARADILTIHLF